MGSGLRNERDHGLRFGSSLPKPGSAAPAERHSLTEERATRLTAAALMLGVLAVSGAVFVILLEAFVAQNQPGSPLEAALVLPLFVLLAGTVAAALFSQRLAVAFFHPSRSEDVAPVPEVVSSRYPRWLWPALGVAAEVLLFILSRATVLPVATAFYVMGGLAFASLLLVFVLRDRQEQDRRADVPLSVFAAWAALYVVNAGLALPVLQLLSVIGFVVLIALVFTQDWSRWWIFAGFLLVLVLNISVEIA